MTVPGRYSISFLAGWLVFRPLTLLGVEVSLQQLWPAAFSLLGKKEKRRRDRAEESSTIAGNRTSTTTASQAVVFVVIVGSIAIADHRCSHTHTPRDSCGNARTNRVGSSERGCGRCCNLPTCVFPRPRLRLVAQSFSSARDPVLWKAARAGRRREKSVDAALKTTGGRGTLRGEGPQRSSSSSFTAPPTSPSHRPWGGRGTTH